MQQNLLFNNNKRYTIKVQNTVVLDSVIELHRLIACSQKRIVTGINNINTKTRTASSVNTTINGVQIAQDIA